MTRTSIVALLVMSTSASRASADEEAAPATSAIRVSLPYVGIGVGGRTTGNAAGPAHIVGYRWLRGAHGVDLSFRYQDGGTGRNQVSAFGATASVLLMRSPAAPRSAYAGLGVGWGYLSTSDSGGARRGAGAQTQLTFGYDVLRLGTHLRVFTQADTVVPMFRTAPENAGMTPGWTPTATLTIGIAHRG